LFREDADSYGLSYRWTGDRRSILTITGERLQRSVSATHRPNDPNPRLTGAIELWLGDTDPNSPAEIEREPSTIVETAGQLRRSSGADGRDDDRHEDDTPSQWLTHDPEEQRKRDHCGINHEKAS
jgi:hypothetical protein